MILYFCLHYWKRLSSLSLFLLSVSQYLNKDSMCYVVVEGKYDAASIDSVRFCCPLCCPLFSIMLCFVLCSICPFHIMVKHTITVIDKSIIHVPHVNVTAEVSVIFSFMNIYKPLKISALISVKTLMES